MNAHVLANDGDYYTKDSSAKAKVVRNARLRSAPYACASRA
ncbi:hypothetical protein [Streptomyces sp. CS090A]|nr:hypothetical protein [Streptomyces sp. CS090A]